MSMPIPPRTAWAAAFALLLLSCFSEKGTSVENSDVPGRGKAVGLHGWLVDAEGKVVAGASVSAYSIAAASAAAAEGKPAPRADSVATDSLGRYAFEALPAGAYLLHGQAEGGEGAVLIPEVDYPGNAAVQRVGIDTLRPVGRVIGRIRTHTDSDSGVACLIAGTSLQSMTDDSGRCALDRVPPGVHVLIYRKEGLLLAVDSAIVVVSGEENAVAVKTLPSDPSLPPPVPTGLTATYDTLQGIARLAWKPSLVADLDGYAVYRNDSSASEPQRVVPFLIKDTVYADTVFRSPADSVDRVVVYRLKAQDKEANLSPVYSKAVTLPAPSPRRVRTSFSFRLENTQGDSASPGDPIGVIVTFTNPTRGHTRLTWHVDGVQARTAMFDGLQRAGVDTLRQSWSEISPKSIRVTATDAGGAAWRDSTRVNIVRDAPIASLSGPATAKVGRPVELTAGAAQRFGSIVMYSWDDGVLPGWDFSGAGLSRTGLAYIRKGAYTARVLVRDDDGNLDSAVHSLAVTNEDPVIVSGPRDTLISLGDTIRFSVSASDPDGIRRYLWDFDGDGWDDDTTDLGSAAHAFPRTVGVYRTFVTVQDSFDGSAKASAAVTVTRDPPVVWAGPDLSASVNDTVRIQGSARDGFGRIIRLDWSLAGGAFAPAAAPETAWVAPGTPGDRRVVLRAMDDDGNEVSDTAVIHVVQDPPVAIITAPSSVLPDSAFTLRASSSTPGYYGKLVAYEWGFGAIPVWVPASGKDTVLTAPDAPGTSITVHLRVTDDDGLTHAVTAVIAIGNLPPKPVEPNHLTEAEKLEGFQLLFDGTLSSFRSHWVDYVKNDTANTNLSSEWSVNSSTVSIGIQNATENIRSKRTYKDFDLRLEYRCDANQGIFYRSLVNTDRAWQTGVQYAINNYTNVSKDAPGAAYDLYPPQPNAYFLFNTGKWNQARIVAIGDSVEHWMNGIKVVGYRYHSPGFWNAYTVSKWNSDKRMTFKVPGDTAAGYIEEGYLGFEADHGGKWQIRTLRIKETNLYFGPVKP